MASVQHRNRVTKARPIPAVCYAPDSHSIEWEVLDEACRRPPIAEALGLHREVLACGCVVGFWKVMWCGCVFAAWPVFASGVDRHTEQAAGEAW